MWNERIVYLNPHDPSRKEFAGQVESEGAKYGFELVANIEMPLGIDQPVKETPTMMVVEGEGIESVSRFAAQKARRKFPDIYVVAISNSGHANWADKTLRRGEINIMEELAGIEH